MFRRFAASWMRVAFTASNRTAIWVLFTHQCSQTRRRAQNSLSLLWYHWYLLHVVTDSPFSQVCRWLGSAGPVVTSIDDMPKHTPPPEFPEAPTTAPHFREPIMDDDDARRADLMEVMTFKQVCAYFKRSANSTRSIIREMGIPPTPWTTDTLRKTYFRRDVYRAIPGGGEASPSWRAAR